MAGIHSFPASQKLKSRKVIGQLFENGNHVKSYPIRAVYGISEYNPDYHRSHVQMGISVPKRSFKSAVDRNKIKRQVRETYRMYHAELLSIAEQKNIYLPMMLVYLDRREPNFDSLSKKMKNLIVQFKEILEKEKI